MVSTLLAQGLEHIATAAMREQAAEVIYLSAEGYSVPEIGRLLQIKRPQVSLLRELAGDGLIEVLRSEGRSDGEIIRTLGVPTARLG